VAAPPDKFEDALNVWRRLGDSSGKCGGEGASSVCACAVSALGNYADMKCCGGRFLWLFLRLDASFLASAGD
jgi:hypothetical protein